MRNWNYLVTFKNNSIFWYIVVWYIIYGIKQINFEYGILVKIFVLIFEARKPPKDQIIICLLFVWKGCHEIVAKSIKLGPKFFLNSQSKKKIEKKRKKVWAILKNDYSVSLCKFWKKRSKEKIENTLREALRKKWIFYDIELISFATYPPYLIMT